MNKKRGIFLSLMLVFAALGSFSYLYYSVNTESMKQALGYVPNWHTPYYIFMFLLGMVTLYLLIKWNKFGLYLIIVQLIFEICTQLFILGPVPYGGLAYFFNLIFTGLFVWAVYRKWNFFS